MAIATLKVGFHRPGTQDAGEMEFRGEPDFLTKAAHALSYTISYLALSYGADESNFIKTGNELTSAWEAAKEGKSFEGEIVKLTFLE